MKKEPEKPIRFIMPPAGLGYLGLLLVTAIAVGASKIPDLVRGLVNLLNQANRD